MSFEQGSNVICYSIFVACYEMLLYSGEDCRETEMKAERLVRRDRSEE